ncbi:hypothetical protein [Saccharicrinis aurantiacus]|nr:hypothetical protein [Saccharicrinis aurantiacus]
MIIKLSSAFLLVSIVVKTMHFSASALASKNSIVGVEFLNMFYHS